MAMTKSEESAAVLANMDIVCKLAHKYSNWGVDRDDLIQEGTIGLLKGMRNWTPEGGASLRTYSAQWAETYIRRAIGTDCAGRLSVPPQTVSLDAPLSSNHDGCLHDILPDSSDSPEDIAARNERVQMVLDATEKLTPKEVQILRSGIMYEVSNEDIGSHVGLTRERIRQIRVQAVAQVGRAAKAAS